MVDCFYQDIVQTNHWPLNLELNCRGLQRNSIWILMICVHLIMNGVLRIDKNYGKKENSNEKNTNNYLCDVKWDKGQEISKENRLIFISSKKRTKFFLNFDLRLRSICFRNFLNFSLKIRNIESFIIYWYCILFREYNNGRNWIINASFSFGHDDIVKLNFVPTNCGIL